MAAHGLSAEGLSAEGRQRAETIVRLYPQRRSALIPLCHLAQSEHGYLTDGCIREIAELVGCLPAEVRGTASFYDMLHLEPVGRYVVAVCTNIACMLAGAYEVLSHAEGCLGVRVGQTTHDRMFTLEEAECLGGCDKAVCVQVNHRFFGPVDEDAFDRLADDLAAGRLDGTVPLHGVLNRVHRSVVLPAKVAKEARAAKAAAATTGAGAAPLGGPASQADPKAAGS